MAGGRPRRYAEALFELARERGTLDPWSRDLRTAADTLGSEHVLQQLSNPELQFDQVRDVLRTIFAPPGSSPSPPPAGRPLPSPGALAPEIVNLLLLLVRRHHLTLLPRIAERYEELVRRERHIEKATVQTAVPLSAQELEHLQGRLVATRGVSSVLLEQQVDPSMIGGVVIRIGDTLLDGSVDARLATLRQALLRER